MKPKLRFKKFNDEWSSHMIKDIADVIGGGTPDTSDSSLWNGNINWFTPSEIGKKKYISNSERKITDLGVQKSSAKLLPIGTILLSSRATIGEASILVNNQACTNQGFQSLVAHENINNEFLYYSKEQFKKEMLNKAFGSTFLEISKGNIEKIKINIPSLEEQIKISNFLSLLDKKIELQTKKIEDLKLFKSYHYSKIFNSDKYEKKKLGEVALCLDNKRKPISSEVRIKGEYPYYGANGIQDYINDYIFDGEYVLLAEDGGNFNDFQIKSIAQFASGKIWVNNHAHVLIGEKIDTKFLFNQLEHMDIREYINGTSRSKLNQADMMNIILQIPEENEQLKINRLFSCIDNKITYEYKKLSKLTELKKGLMQSMFV